MNKAILLALMFLSGPAMAGTVYRCVGPDGVPNYTSKRASNAVCKAITTSAPSRLSSYSPKATTPAPVASPAATAAAPAAPSAKQVVFQTTAGDAAPPAAKRGA